MLLLLDEVPDWDSDRDRGWGLGLNWHNLGVSTAKKGVSLTGVSPRVALDVLGEVFQFSKGGL